MRFIIKSDNNYFIYINMNKCIDNSFNQSVNDFIIKKNIISTFEMKFDEIQSKILFANCVEASSTSISIGELAKLMKQNGINIGKNRLLEWLRKHHYLMQSRSNKNIPTQFSMDRNLFEITEKVIHYSSGRIHIIKTIKVTGKGQIYFLNRFLNLLTN